MHIRLINLYVQKRDILIAAVWAQGCGHALPLPSWTAAGHRVTEALLAMLVMETGR